MIKFSNFCGIFATVFVTTTIILLASCSQDDDYYESDMYTLAEMETRGGGGDPGNGGGEPDPPMNYFGNPVKAGTDTITFEIERQEMQVFISWSRGFTGMSSPVSNIVVTPIYWDTLQCYTFLYPDNLKYKVQTYIGSSATWFGPNDGMRIRVDYVKDSVEIVRNHNDTADSIIYFPPYIKHSCYEYHPTCVPDPTLQPL